MPPRHQECQARKDLGGGCCFAPSQFLFEIRSLIQTTLLFCGFSGALSSFPAHVKARLAPNPKGEACDLIGFPFPGNFIQIVAANGGRFPNVSHHLLPSLRLWGGNRVPHSDLQDPRSPFVQQQRESIPRRMMTSPTTSRNRTSSQPQGHSDRLKEPKDEGKYPRSTTSGPTHSSF